MSRGTKHLFSYKLTVPFDQSKNIPPLHDIYRKVCQIQVCELRFPTYTLTSDKVRLLGSQIWHETANLQRGSFASQRRHGIQLAGMPLRRYNCYIHIQHLLLCKMHPVRRRVFPSSHHPFLALPLILSTWKYIHHQLTHWRVNGSWGVCVDRDPVFA